MNDFKGRHFEGQIILWAVRWYCKYGVSYRELGEMLEERSVSADHTWTQRYAPRSRSGCAGTGAGHAQRAGGLMRPT